MALTIRSSNRVASLRSAATYSVRPLPAALFRRSQQQRLVISRAETTETTKTTEAIDSIDAANVDTEKLMKDLQQRWDAIENKPQVAIYGVGAVFAIWLTTTVLGAINNVPILPKFLELVGLGYSAWFTYRYLLFKSSREELIKDVEELKSKITGN